MSQTADTSWRLRIDRWRSDGPQHSLSSERNAMNDRLLGVMCLEMSIDLFSPWHTLNLVRREILQMIQKSYRTTDFLQLYSILFPLPAIPYLWSDKLSLKRRTIEYRFPSNVNKKKTWKRWHTFISFTDGFCYTMVERMVINRCVVIPFIVIIISYIISRIWEIRWRVLLNGLSVSTISLSFLTFVYIKGR